MSLISLLLRFHYFLLLFTIPSCLVIVSDFSLQMRCAVAVGETLEEGEERIRKTIENSCLNNSWLVNHPPQVFIFIYMAVLRLKKINRLKLREEVLNQSLL